MNEKAIGKDRVNLNELAYDAALFLFPLLLERYYDRLMAFRPCGLPFVQLFLAFAIYFLPLLIGKMYNVDFRDSSKRARKCVLVIFWVTLCFAFGNLLYLVISSFREAGSFGKHVMVTALVFLIMGPIAGLIFTKDDAPVVQGASTQLFLFLLTAGCLPMFYLIISAEAVFGDTGVLLGMLIVIGLVIGDALFILLLYGAYAICKKLILRAGLYDTGLFLMRLLAPFCVSFLLVCFHINSGRLFMTGIGTGGVRPVLLLVVFYLASGVLPLRIMMMLTPPRRPVNIVIGALSALFMILVVAFK